MTATIPRRRGRVLATDTALLYPLLPLIAKGMTNRQIGREIHLSEDGVKDRISALLQHLGVEQRVQAVAVAYERGLLGSKSRRAPAMRRELFDRHASWCALLRTPMCNCESTELAVTVQPSEEYL